MKFKACLIYLPTGIFVGYLGIMQYFIGDNIFLKGSVFASISLVLYSLAYLVVRNVMRDAVVPLRRYAKMIVFISGSLLLALIGVTLATTNEDNTLLIAVTVLNTSLSFVCLFLCISMSKSTDSIVKSNNVNQYNPSTGLPVYSGYIDVRGNPVGAPVRNKNI